MHSFFLLSCLTASGDDLAYAVTTLKGCFEEVGRNGMADDKAREKDQVPRVTSL